MPFWASPAHLHFSAQCGTREDDTLSPSAPSNGTFRLWRWRISALMAICTVLLLVTTISAFSHSLPAEMECSISQVYWKSTNLLETCIYAGFETSVELDPSNEENEENESVRIVWIPASIDFPRKRQEFLRRIKSVDQQFKERGLTRMYTLRSVFNLKLEAESSSSSSSSSPTSSSTASSSASSQQSATLWPSNKPRRRRGPGAFSDRQILVARPACTNKDISIFQSPDGSSGIPRYAVQIMNNCMSDCPPSDIHVFCGWFASALLVNPNSFKRVSYNDCIVNGGKPLRRGETLRFTRVTWPLQQRPKNLWENTVFQLPRHTIIRVLYKGPHVYTHLPILYSRHPDTTVIRNLGDAANFIPQNRDRCPEGLSKGETQMSKSGYSRNHFEDEPVFNGVPQH
uniref:Uncharacterized protein n=1 Tax=Physcomitrium patens TaxID=3218 RepID=A0A2K1KJ01_PHYPA|nr:hypothetical protein PHYPA_007432 [Physcomitrium patens]